MIVGIDEVGRGAWAGPLVVGAVLLGGARIEGLTDSKKLTKSRRIELDREIRMKARAIGLGWVSARQLDLIGLSEALKLASRRAVHHLSRHEYGEIIIDGTIRLLDDTRVTLMKKADLLVPSVSAASIVAKVARDNYMAHLDGVFPGYGFKSHVGYGTARHQKAITDLGVSTVHRASFTPIKESKRVNLAATKWIGDAAEDVVASYLQEQGHGIVARNWRTKYCEIDIVSLKGMTLYFTEVKYRRDDSRGGGLAAVTPSKLRQMTFAAELFTARYSKRYDAMRLAVAGVTGTPPNVGEFLELP